MEDKYALITTLVAAIVLAFVLGFVAQRLRLSPIVGYLLAGVAVGPHTPGFTGNTDLALQLSEIGVILLMFGVGLKISIEDIWSVRWVAVPGSVFHTVLSAALGALVGIVLRLPLMESIILGISVSIASTIVFLRAVEERKLLKSEPGRIGISWLLIEDLLIILAIVVLPALVWSTSQSEAEVSPWRIAGALGVTVAKIAGFVALIMVIDKSDLTLGKQKWTGSKVALVELIYALHAEGVFNNGSSDLKDVAEFFEHTLNVDLGQFHRTFLEIRMRKSDRTKFLNSLRDSVLKRMDEADET